MCKEKNMPDWVVVKTPKVWCPVIHKTEKPTCTITATSTNDVPKNSFNSNPVPTAKASRHKSAGTVQQRNTNDCETTRQFISSKRLQKLLKRGEQVYLAMVRPTGIQKQGITQKIKQQIMKEKGPIRKAPPIAETRRKMCNEAPVAIRKRLQGLLEQYAELFPEQLPKGRPPKRAVEFEINTEEGAVPPNNLRTDSVPKNMMNCKHRSMICWHRDTSDLPLARMVRRSCSFPKRTDDGECVWTTVPSIDRQSAIGIPFPVLMICWTVWDKPDISRLWTWPPAITK